MNLTIDIGNTCTKLVVFDNDYPVHETICDGELLPAINAIVEKYPISLCAWCSVRNNERETEELLHHFPFRSRQLRGDTEVPLPVAYQNRKTLGADRLAAVLGATALQPNENLLIIDAGTCITYDFVSAHHGYLGGNISPGLDMRLKALAHFTAKLPKVEAHGELPEIGKNTETAIRCGVIHGIAHEIEGYVDEMRLQHTDLKVFFTGGNGFDFTGRWAQQPINEPLLVARGLNRLLSLTSR